VFCCDLVFCGVTGRSAGESLGRLCRGNCRGLWEGGKARSQKTAGKPVGAGQLVSLIRRVETTMTAETMGWVQGLPAADGWRKEKSAEMVRGGCAGSVAGAFPRDRSARDRCSRCLRYRSLSSAAVARSQSRSCGPKREKAWASLTQVFSEPRKTGKTRGCSLSP